MKAEELMIGDWVCTEHDSTPRQIDWIRTGEVGLFWNKVVTPPYLVPIPLTPEILEKNGFERAACGVGAIIYTFSDDDEYYALAIDEYTDSIWRVEYTNCEMHFPLVRIMVLFVHDLQHALRLCGIEKTIEL